MGRLGTGSMCKIARVYRVWDGFTAPAPLRATPSHSIIQGLVFDARCSVFLDIGAWIFSRAWMLGFGCFAVLLLTGPAPRVPPSISIVFVLVLVPATRPL